MFRRLLQLVPAIRPVQWSFSNSSPSRDTCVRVYDGIADPPNSFTSIPSSRMASLNHASHQRMSPWIGRPASRVRTLNVPSTHSAS